MDQLETLLKATLTGDPQSVFKIRKILAGEVTHPFNLEAIFKTYRDNLKNPTAQNLYCEYYLLPNIGKYRGSDKAKTDEVVITSFLTKNVEGPTPNADSLWILGLLALGKGNHEEALKLWRRSVDSGSAHAQHRLGQMSREGTPPVSRDYVEAVRLFSLSADQDYDEAQFWLGYMYLNGFGTPQNYPDAFRWFKRSADQGNLKAINAVAYMYQYGYGVDRNLSEAIRYYRVTDLQRNTLQERDRHATVHTGFMNQLLRDHSVDLFTTIPELTSKLLEVPTLQNTVSSLQDRLTTLLDRTTSLETADTKKDQLIQSLGDRIPRLDDRISRLDDRIPRPVPGIERLKAETARLKDRILDLEGDSIRKDRLIMDLTDRIRRLEEHFIRTQNEKSLWQRFTEMFICWDGCQTQRDDHPDEQPLLGL